MDMPKTGALRSRLAHFGPSGLIGLAIVAFWVLAAIFGPALLSRTGAMGGGFNVAPLNLPGGEPVGWQQPIMNATGGDYLVNRPTLFIAGEAGPERATFTPQNGMGGGVEPGTQVTINFYNSPEPTQNIAALKALWGV